MTGKGADFNTLKKVALDLGCWQDEEGKWYGPDETAGFIGNDGAEAFSRKPGSNVVERARKYVALMPESISGNSGHDAAWLVAQALTRGFLLSQADAWPLLVEFNQRCQPPWSESELRHKLEDADQNSRAERGFILAKSKQHSQGSNGFHSTNGFAQRVRRVEEVESPVTASLDPEEFPVLCFPSVVRRFVEEIAASMGCPVDFPATAVLVAAASAIGTSRAIALKRSWLECPRFYIAQVCDPGAAKSPSVKPIYQPLYTRQNEQAARWKQEHDDYEALMRDYEGLKRRQKAKDAPALSLPEKPIAPTYPHLYTTDATTESLAPILSENQRGIVLIRDEISGWVMGMNQYKGGKGSDRQFWLSAWSGEPAKVDRKSTRESGAIIVPHPFINVVGGIQPDMLSELCDERSREDGFIHRILFCYPRMMIGVPWSEATPSEESECDWDTIIDRLLSLQMHTEEDGTQRPHVCQMTPDAKSSWIEWYDEHAAEMRSPDFPYALIGPWSKLRSYCARLALTLHFIWVAAGAQEGEEISETSMKAARLITEYFKAHLHRVYGRLKARPEDCLAEQLVEWITAHGGKCKAGDLIAAHFAKKAEQAVGLLRDLEQRGHGHVEEKDSTGGRKVTWFQLKERGS